VAQSSIEASTRMFISTHRAQAQLAGEVRNVSLLVAIGVNESGYREILGICEGEGGQDWLERVPQASQGTRAEGCAADHLGCLHRACRERRRVLSEAAWQRCIVHWYRNIFSTCLDQGAGDRGHAQGDPPGEDIAAAREKAIRVIEKLRGLRLSRAAELWDDVQNLSHN